LLHLVLALVLRLVYLLDTAVNEPQIKRTSTEWHKGSKLDVQWLMQTFSMLRKNRIGKTFKTIRIKMHDLSKFDNDQIIEAKASAYLKYNKINKFAFIILVIYFTT